MKNNLPFSKIASGVPVKSAKAGDLVFSIFEETEVLKSNTWKQFESEAPVFLSADYLEVERAALSDRLEHRYAIFQRNGEAIGVAVFHLITVQTKEAVNRLRKRFGVLDKAVTVLSGGNQNFDFRLLICGSPFTTGELGFHFSNSIDEEVQIAALRETIAFLRQAEKKNISAVLLKDFYKKQDGNAAEFEKDGFTPFCVEPNMMMPVSPDWKSLEDYLDSLRSKYRTKANAALRRSEQIEIREFKPEELENHRNRIEELYEQVLSRASFGIGSYNFEMFKMLLSRLPNRYRMYCYFFEGELIAFQTLWLHREDLEAHFVGIDYDKNFELAVYQRMLYEYVRIAISEKKSLVVFGRSAMEIKSTVGAIPVDATCYIRHKGAALNPFLSFIFRHVEPSDFRQHRAFRASKHDELKSSLKPDS